ERHTAVSAAAADRREKAGFAAEDERRRDGDPHCSR
nr:hypothetical protein [Tanacetum cinerariifolium]